MRRQRAIVVGFVSLLSLVSLLLVAIGIHQAGPRIHEIVRDRTAKLLQARFKSQVEFSDFDVSLFPRVQLTISGLVMRHKGRTDIPPLFQIRKVSVYANLMSLLRAKPRITLV